jgi:hypothetical protein
MANLVEDLFFYANQLKGAVIDAAKQQGMEKISLDFINTIAENDEMIKHPRTGMGSASARVSRSC